MDIEIKKDLLPDDMLVVKFDYNDMGPEIAASIVDRLAERFPCNKVIGIPINGEISMRNRRKYTYE